jgi:hypothetical protein
MKDKAIQLADNVSIAATGAIGDVLDFGAAISAEPDVVYQVLVTETFVGGTSVALKLQTSEDKTNWVDVCAYPVIDTATGVAGFAVDSKHLPVNKVKRYLRAYNTATGTFTAGKVSIDAETWSSERE